MATVLITNIRQLVNVREDEQLLRGRELSVLPVIENAFLLLEDDQIAAYGRMNEIGELETSVEKAVDASGQFVLPCWCDSHTHLVYAVSREEEFVEKIKGSSYAEIASKGGGILNSARKLNEIAEDALFYHAWKRLEEVTSLGTGAIEIKSGYGLSVVGELKMLRVIKRLRQRSSLFIRSTFLAAHAYPPEFRDNHQGYIDLIVSEMLPVIAKEKLADYIDVFCENGFFSPEETEKVCKAGIYYGLKPKIHANQLSPSGGVETGIRVGALSVDHLESMTSETISALASSKTIGTLLPTAAYFLRMHYPPARELIDSGCAIALASDYNPGSSPSGNMNQVVSMACIGMKMLPEEAINAATVNGAFAMEAENERGSIGIGKKANIIITKQIPSLAYLPYAFGTNNIDKVMINGEFVG